MNTPKHPLLSIGSFASATRLSLKALRLYDRLGICKPSHVDPESGYRYYQVTQLRDARLIRMMRQMDMPLATIRQVLAAAPAEAEQLVQNYWHQREQRMEQARRAVPDLMRYLRQENSAMSLHVEVQTIEPQQIVSITRSLTVEHLSSTIRRDLDTLYSLAAQHQIPITGASFGIYQGPINHEDDGPIEICLPVGQSITPAPPEVICRELAGGIAASVTLRSEQCAFPTLLAGYDAVQDWIQQHGYEAIDAPREIWHTPPGTDARWDIVWLFQKLPIAS